VDRCLAETVIEHLRLTFAIPLFVNKNYNNMYIDWATALNSQNSACELCKF